MSNLLLKLLLFYSHRMPYHRGKWQIVEHLLTLLRLRSDVEAMELEVERRGVRWHLKPGCLVQRSLYLFGVYEINETNWVLDQVEDNWNVLDIGSNFGYYSMLIASRAPKATIYAFEPHSVSYAALDRHRQMNHYDQVKPQRIALSDSEGSLRLVVPPSVNGGIGHLETGGGDVAAGHQIEDVQTMPLDSFASRNAIDRVDFIKIDVEGAELMVLDGARETIARCRPKMLIEINPSALQRFGRSAEELLERIRSLGYRAYRIRGKKLEELQDTASIGDYVNVACLPA